MAGINQLKEGLAFVVSLGNAIGKSMEDGRLTIWDLKFALEPLMKLAPAFDGVGEIPAELKDLSKEEFNELCDYVASELKLPQEKIEAAIENGLVVLKKIYEIIDMLGLLKPKAQ